MTVPTRVPARRSAEVATWDPLRELDELRERMTGLLSTSLGDTRTGVLAGWAPAVAVEETDESFVVEAELPGVRREDITVEIRGDELATHGEVVERERTGILRRRTRRTDRFDYRVVLPGGVDTDDVAAKRQDGVLRVVVPKAAQAEPHRVDITTG